MPTDSPTCILAVDDSPDTLELLQRHLKPAGHIVIAAAGAEEAARLLKETPFNLVITDMKMPKISGLDLIRHIRDNFKDIGILMITGYPSIGSAVEAVRLGADDYLAKPFNPRELVARLRAILRRSKWAMEKLSVCTTSVRHRVDDVEMDMGMRTVFKAGEPVELTSVEFSLLEMLLFKAGRVVTRDELTQTVLGRSLLPYDRSIDVHVSKLRKKLGQDSGGAERIKSIRGSGRGVTSNVAIQLTMSSPSWLVASSRSTATMVRTGSNLFMVSFSPSWAGYWHGHSAGVYQRPTGPVSAVRRAVNVNIAAHGIDAAEPVPARVAT